MRRSALRLVAGDMFDRAIAEFSTAYADQNERDYAAFTEAVNSGRLIAQTGVETTADVRANTPRQPSGHHGALDLPRAFRTADYGLIHAADCCSRYSLWTCCGVRY